MKTRIVRAAHFSCGYSLSETQEFGRNFRLEASFEGIVDADSGMIANLVDIDSWIAQVVDQLDHHFLATDVAYFQTRTPTPERIVHFIFDELSSLVPAQVRLVNVRLFENENRWLDYGPP